MHIGKFLLVWKFSQVEAVPGGRPRAPESLVDEAVEMGLGMVAVKIADGAAAAGSSAAPERLRYYVQALQRRGVQVWGWHYLYGGRRLVRGAAGQVIGSAENHFSTPEREAAAAVSQVRAYGLDGYIMDPEAEYKSAPAGRAARFAGIVRVGLGSLPLALCSYRYPNFHRELPWGEFLAQCDYHMPQVYWGHGPQGDGRLPGGRYLAAAELENSLAQLRLLKDIPCLPLGRAYIGDGHAGPQPAEISAFLAAASALGCMGAGLWNWDSLRPAYPGAAGRAAALRAFDFGPAPAPPSAPPSAPPPAPPPAANTITCPRCQAAFPLPTQAAPLPVQAAPPPVQAAPLPVQAAPLPSQAAPLPVQAAPAGEAGP